MTYLVYVAIFSIVIIAIICSIISKNKIKKYGVEADAIVSRIEEVTTEKPNSSTGEIEYETEKTYYVAFKDEDGIELEVRLMNPSFRQRQGDRIKVKYLPEKPNKALRIKEKNWF